MRRTGDLYLQPLSQQVVPKLRVLTQKSETVLQLQTHGTTRGKTQQASVPLFIRCCNSPSLDPMGYHGSNLWHGVANKLMDKCKCSEHLVPVPPKSPEEVHQLLDKCNPPPMEASRALLRAGASQHAKAPVSYTPCMLH